MKRGSQLSDGKSTFSFLPSFTSPTITVEWVGDVAFFEEKLAKLLIKLGYAELPTAEQVGEINEAVENDNKIPNDKSKDNRKEQKNDSTANDAELPTAEQVKKNT